MIAMSSATGTHGGERLVTRRVEEDDALAVLDDLARADVLGDAAALACGDLGRPDRIEQAGLAMVDVAHDGDDGRTRLEEGRIVLLEQQLLGRLADGLVAGAVGAIGAVRVDRLGDLVAELARDERRGVTVDELVDRREDAALDELPDHVRGVDREQIRELLDGDRRGQFDGSALARVGDLDGPAAERAIAARRLARAAPAAGAAPTPGHGLLLWCSVWSCWLVGLAECLRECRPHVVGQPCRERPTEGSGRKRPVEAGRVTTDVGAPPGGTPGLVDAHDTIRRANDAQELPLRPARPAGDAGPAWDAPDGSGSLRPAYDGTSSVTGVAAAGVSSVVDAGIAPLVWGSTATSALAVFDRVVRFGLAGVSASAAGAGSSV
jgi:hypothetical protein